MTCTVTAAREPGTGTAPAIPAPTPAMPIALPTGATLPRPVEADAVIPVVSTVCFFVAVVWVISLPGVGGCPGRAGHVCLVVYVFTTFLGGELTGGVGGKLFCTVLTSVL